MVSTGIKIKKRVFFNYLYLFLREKKVECLSNPLKKNLLRFFYFTNVWDSVT